MQNLTYDNLEIQNYLQPNEYKTPAETTKFIFQTRTRMLHVKENFKNGNQSYLCDVCGKHNDTQKEMLTCEALSSGKEIWNEPIVYEDIYCSSYEKILRIGQILKCKYEIRNEIINLRKKNIL